MKPFRFKEFTVQQDASAMKIGTDAVLLGAWTCLDDFPDSLLDIGAGTGVIALQLAQRCDAQTIDAVELEAGAYAQAVTNFEASDWGDRLFCYHTSFQDFATEMAEDSMQYDAIVSNPPFYTDQFETEDVARNTARFTSALSFEELLKGVAKILSPTGMFSVIIPFKEQESFVSLAQEQGLFLCRLTSVRGTESSPVVRSLLAFSFQKKEVENTHLAIEKARHQYTEEYRALTKDFYLKM